MIELNTRIDGNHRILVVDDNPSIHEDFKKILPTKKSTTSELDDLLLEILEDETPASTTDVNQLEYEIDHAYQGEDALEMVREAEASGKPYALLFVDVRMPPGWDGIETIKRIWTEFPHNEVVICTAYSDYSWEDILEELGSSDQLQFLRKPFDVVSIKQMALAITRKWNLAKKSRQYTEDLEKDVKDRTQQLQDKVTELEKALSEIKQLQGILPMCAWCHKIRSDDDYWQQVDEYLSSHQMLEISHGICPDCYDKMMDKVEEEEKAGESAQTPQTESSADETIMIGGMSPSDVCTCDHGNNESPSGKDVGSQALAGRINLQDLQRQLEKEDEQSGT